MTYELVELEQGSPEWLQFRKERIGSSDAAIVMGLNPWRTPYSLWQEKVNGVETIINEAMKRGTELEPIARKLFCDQRGIHVRPVVAVSKERPWQMTSLDGLSEDGKVLLEIKCGGRELYEKALRGEIPPYYMCQMQHHIGVCKPDVAYYTCMYGEETTTLEVNPDTAFIKEMFDRQEQFWMKHIFQKEPPELTDRDYEKVEHPRGSVLLDEYNAMGDQIKAMEERRKEIKMSVIEIGPQRNFILNGQKIYLTQNSSYDFKRMKEDGIELEKYKKASNPYWMIASPPKSLRTN